MPAALHCAAYLLRTGCGVRGVAMWPADRWHAAADPLIELITSSVSRYRPAPTTYPLHNSTLPAGYLQAGLTLCRCCLVAHAAMLHAGLSGSCGGSQPHYSTWAGTIDTCADGEQNPPPIPPHRNSSALPTQYAGRATAADL